ncbi:hypothetical protein DO97_15690 [Neosynechococcus sphagnicola sy1]|uniref:3-deoxy-D-manno-octulosonate 8-phosphate phosphatase n=1 Tax=Neosynechococcus sphagnicola sy1 TaxID=1497020 RepID=A0A098TLQ8_9CYAN|nr:hypothetical protein DO97_15690 [Neosynechococcus sphagnicola sy1]
MRPHLKKRLSKIKLLLIDVDGVMTDGQLYYSEQGETLKAFNVRDGLGLRQLITMTDIEIGILSGGNAPIVRSRAAKLGIELVLTAIEDKVAAAEKLLQQRGLNWDQLSYIGDDVNDIELLQKSGVSAAPIDAHTDVRRIVNWQLSAKGGHGAIRHFADAILRSRGIKPMLRSLNH